MRVCYRRADETGVRWDERVTARHSKGPTRWRQIRTYALRGLGGGPGWVAPHTAYRVEQRYRQLAGSSRTVLAFQTSLARPAWPVAGMLFNRFFRPEVKRVFALNLENIKAAIEAEQAGGPYDRPHPYETNHPWE